MHQSKNNTLRVLNGINNLNQPTLLLKIIHNDNLVDKFSKSNVIINNYALIHSIFSNTYYRI